MEYYLIYYLFVFGNDYKGRVGEINVVGFWYYVIEGLKLVWKCRSSDDMDSILFNAFGCNGNMAIPFKKGVAR